MKNFVSGMIIGIIMVFVSIAIVDPIALKSPNYEYRTRNSSVRIYNGSTHFQETARVLVSFWRFLDDSELIREYKTGEMRDWRAGFQKPF